MSAIGAIQAASSAAVDSLLWPVRGLAPVWQLAVLSAVIAAVVLVSFKYTSDQHGLAQAKKRVQAQLLRIVLYRHDLTVMLHAERDLLLSNLSYVKHAVVPLLVILGPMVLVFARLESRYAHDPLAVDQAATLSVHLRDADAARQEWRLDTPAGVEVETAALRIPSLREVNWRLHLTEPGRHTVTVRSSDASFTKTVEAGPGPAEVSARRASGLDAILTPAELPLPSGAAVTAIDVAYPMGSIPVGPWRVNWILAFLVGTFLFAAVLRGPLRAQF